MFPRPGGIVFRRIACVLALCVSSLPADEAVQPSLTIYNQNFAVVRQELPLNLKAGPNKIQLTDITMHLEPDSVILRDPSGKHPIQVLEQNYRADPISESLLLSLNEGKTIDFLVQRENKQEVVTGKIIRSGYTPHNYMAMNRYGQQYYQAQMAYAQGGNEQPILEVDCTLRFGLPGVPLFPSLGDETILKPTLQWLLSSDQAGPIRTEFSYVTGGLTWEADYNIAAPDKGDVVDLVGWVTMDNQSGKTFDNARIKLMAGDVSKIQPRQMYVATLRIGHLRLVILLAIAIHGHVVVRGVSATDDFAGDDFLLVLALHQEIDRLALVERKQQRLRNRVGTVVLFQHLNRMLAARITQNDRIRLQMHRDIRHLKFVDSCLQIQREFLADDGEILVIDGERRLHCLISGQTRDTQGQHTCDATEHDSSWAGEHWHSVL